MPAQGDAPSPKLWSVGDHIGLPLRLILPHPICLLVQDYIAILIRFV